jgi:hypothetical protein
VSLCVFIASRLQQQQGAPRHLSALVEEAWKLKAQVSGVQLLPAATPLLVWSTQRLSKGALSTSPVL